MSIIRMDCKLFDEIVQYAKEHLPEEACGLIAGDIDGNDKTIKKICESNRVDKSKKAFIRTYKI